MTTVVVMLYAAIGSTTLVSAESAAATAPAVQIDGEALDVGAALRSVDLQILRLESQIYALRRRVVEDAVAKRLLEREAARRSMTIQALLAEEVDSKVVPPTEAEVDARATRPQRGDAAGGTPEDIAEMRQGIRASLVEQRRVQQRAQFVASLRAKANITIEGLDPPVPKAVVAPEGEPSLGPADAPVTIVEFSDFQCPYCRQAQATLKALLQQYAGKVRLVYRDFPVPQLHPGAAAAAEAARCAGEQGKFWQYHDLLYENPTKQAKSDLIRYADELGLDRGRFHECVQGRRYANVVARGVTDGKNVGVVGTPTFFVNGIPLIGARPLSEFTAVIDRELSRQGRPAAGPVRP